jgi:hypothetical protein
MPDARTKPSQRPDSRGGSRTNSSQPPRAITRLEEALVDAERMAKRVDRVLDADPFAAALLAREYLSLVPERDVNPLDQRGRTDAWTSAFVRLRYAAKLLEKDDRRVDGEAYLAARAEERRLFTLFGSAPRTRLLALRSEVRRRRRQKRALEFVACLSIAGALAAVAAAFALGNVWIGVAGAGAGAFAAAAFFAAAGSVARALATLTQGTEELERGISRLAVFETSDSGRGTLQRLQREHPLLVHTSLGEGSSVPPPASEHKPRPQG